MRHDHLTTGTQETAALYALGALSQNEAIGFDVHRREGCPVCETELKHFEQVVDLLGAAVEAAPPPAYVRDLLAVRIEREASEAPALSRSVIRFPEQPGAVAKRKPAAFRSSSRGVLLPWAVAAALLIAFVYTFTAWQTDRRSFQAATEPNSGEAATVAHQENEELKAQLNKESARAAELAQINSVLSSPRWRIIPLGGQEPAPDSSARVYWDVQGNRWVVTADLPPPPEGKVYQLWFVTPEAKVSAGLISPGKTGHAFTVVQFPANLARLEAAAITLESEGGSLQPTMPIYVLGKAS